MVFESCPLEREGPLGCGHVCHTLIACHGEASSCVVGLAACAPIPEVSFSCLLILVRLASWANMYGFSSSMKTADKGTTNDHLKMCSRCCHCQC